MCFEDVADSVDDLGSLVAVAAPQCAPASLARLTAASTSSVVGATKVSRTSARGSARTPVIHRRFSGCVQSVSGAFENGSDSGAVAVGATREAVRRRVAFTVWRARTDAANRAAWSSNVAGSAARSNR